MVKWDGGHLACRVDVSLAVKQQAHRAHFTVCCRMHQGCPAALRADEGQEFMLDCNRIVSIVGVLTARLVQKTRQ